MPPNCHPRVSAGPSAGSGRMLQKINIPLQHPCQPQLAIAGTSLLLLRIANPRFEPMKEHLFYVFLFIFLATALLTLAGIAKWIRIDHFYLKRLCGVLLLELSAAVISTYHRAD